MKQKEYRFVMLSLGMVFLILAVYMYNSAQSCLREIYSITGYVEHSKERFICNGSKCKIVYLNKKNTVVSTPKLIYRFNIGDIELRHVDEAVTNRSVMFGSRRHTYYLRILPQNLDRTNYKEYSDYLIYNLIELGPISTEKQANKILEQLKSSIHTDKDIDIEIKLGASRSF